MATALIEATNLARRISDGLEALPEPRMRAVVVSEQLTRLPATEAAVVLAELVRIGRDAMPAPGVAVRSLMDALGDDVLVPYEVRADWYRAAKAEGDEDLCRLLLAIPAHRKAPPPRPMASPIPGRDEVTLGERRSLARGQNKEILERLLVDPEPLVIRNLLRNPQLTESWVMRVVTRRPLRAEIIHEIIANDRWYSRYQVRLAVARNPYTPTDVAVRVVQSLMRQDLREIAGDGTLHDEVRRAASAALKSP